MEEVRGVMVMVEITFEDVEIALKVLREFQKKAREVDRVLRRFGASRSSYRMPRGMEDFINLVLQSYKSKQEHEETEEHEEELTEEELNKLREIAEKIKKK